MAMRNKIVQNRVQKISFHGETAAMLEEPEKKGQVVLIGLANSRSLESVEGLAVAREENDACDWLKRRYRRAKGIVSFYLSLVPKSTYSADEIINQL